MENSFSFCRAKAWGTVGVIQESRVFSILLKRATRRLDRLGRFLAFPPDKAGHDWFVDHDDLFAARNNPASAGWPPVQAKSATVSGSWQARTVRLTAAGS
jgi:hypothetical protein